jgi:Skp family chaperone for outer membrane proteins
MIRKILPWVAVIGVCLAPAAMAQTAAPASPAVPTKIAVIDIQAAIAGTAEGKLGLAELQSRFAPQSAAIEAIDKKIADLEKRALAGQNTLSDEEKARMQSDHTVLQHQSGRMREELEEEANAAQAELFDGIGHKMLDVQDRYARENGIAVVINSSGQQTPVLLYRAEQVDITKDIIKLYDQQFPVKAATTTPAPKPSTPQTPAQTPAKKPGGQQ